MMNFVYKIFGNPNEKIVKELQPVIAEINGWEEKMERMSNDELRNLTMEWQKQFTTEKEIAKEEIEKKMSIILPQAFAAVREAAKRTLGKRLYDVQLIGGIVLHRGQIAEMKTGEGKTFVATAPLYLNALTGRGVQLVTVNDYLSRVGAGWMAPVYHLLGMTTSVIVHDSAFIYDPEYSDDTQYDERLKHFRQAERREAYSCDILYGTNNEFGFDYLRDNMVPNLSQMVQRGLNYAIVDEIDSILIDEARTPLIISAPAEESTEKYYKFAQLVRQLKENEDYNIDEKMRAATLTEGGIAKMEKWLGVDNIYTTGGIAEVHHIEQALKAHALFKLDRDYIVKEGEVIIVDEFTGRLMHGRRYSEGLHQAIEAKEGVKIQRESQTLATVTFQNYFRMYNKLAGMTGTAATEAEEFAKIYSLDTVVIPTNRPNIRKDNNDLIYRTEEAKYKAVIRDIKEKTKKGQPVLVGTISIEKNEVLAQMMEREGLHPNILNAKNHEKEARFISEAGKSGSITLATNMAGRGVDIMLGGHEPEKGEPAYEEWKKEHEKVVAAGGLHVVGTERHESRRIDNQLRGRAGRQGDPGSSQFYVSMEDDLMRIFGGDRMKNLMITLKVPDDMPIENKIISKSIESAQTKVEGNNFDIRKHLLEYDDVLNKHRETIYRKRREIMVAAEKKDENEAADRLASIVLEMIENEIEQVVSFHTAAENSKDWNLDEIYQVTSTIFPLENKLKEELLGLAQDEHKLDKIKIRTQIIEHLVAAARDNYVKITKRCEELNLNWREIEKAVLIRSIDTLWIEHLEAMTSMRQGIGLRGYGQRDPLIEYKKEAYKLFNELNNLIQKEVVYSIFKVGMMQESMARGFKETNLADRAKQFIAPSKTMDSSNTSFSGLLQGAKKNDGKPSGSVDSVKQKVRNAAGDKVGRNDLCPCGSGKKYKKCCGK
ncbi:MAG: preprotein translocase subunit SecA [Parcubacteria group bacterium ADurb.Bin316]|nr:MAG: preprotein translocase subunit SecA [Parcubacteria group bacterium ADurb.Bin316]HOZ56238.1 preprotein translocase subunit SecA [bacterium]